MKNLWIILAITFSMVAYGQSSYDKEMEIALKAWKNNNQEGLNAFKQISEEYLPSRLPQYYMALIQTLISFESNDLIKKEALIDEAKLAIEGLRRKYPNDPEILNLKALNLTAEIVLNPMKNGMALMDEVNETYREALNLEPNNPRSILGQAEFNLNASKFIGGDITSNCNALEKALALFKLEKKQKFEPQWGQKQAENVLKNQCNNQ
ncbi:hypothetical protein [Faecalibacter sp. LW9]|uniref:hypothetical protein n=1 Tax=Faecalibacter sp. LW9 TaxID=3103144 RepID=UPI002AFEF1D3|nr:hypothetical protein [Faecalibacter sp. LW9]